ncbi:hypothetical protein Tco_0177804 [Tanacetum coccineum]
MASRFNRDAVMKENILDNGLGPTVEKFLSNVGVGLPIEVEPLDETPLEDLGLNTCNHDTPLSSREIPGFDESEPQPQPFPSFPSLEVGLGEERDLEQPIKPPSPDSFRMKEVDHLTIHTPPSPYVTFSTLRMCIAIITHALMILRNIIDLNQVY